MGKIFIKPKTNGAGYTYSLSVYFARRPIDCRIQNPFVFTSFLKFYFCAIHRVFRGKPMSAPFLIILFFCRFVNKNFRIKFSKKKVAVAYIFGVFSLFMHRAPRRSTFLYYVYRHLLDKKGKKGYNCRCKDILKCKNMY